MAKFGDGGDLLKCSFCGKSQKQVKKLIAGPGVYICDECIDLCNEIIEEELSQSTEVKFDELPKPREIYGYLNDYVIGQEQAKKILSVVFLKSRTSIALRDDMPTYHCPLRPPNAEVSRTMSRTHFAKSIARGAPSRCPRRCALPGTTGSQTICAAICAANKAVINALIDPRRQRFSSVGSARNWPIRNEPSLEHASARIGAERMSDRPARNRRSATSRCVSCAGRHSESLLVEDRWGSRSRQSLRSNRTCSRSVPRLDR